MIGSTTQPGQIIVIDDNQAWLNVCAALQIRVFNCSGKSHRALVDFIQPIKDSVLYVVVNMHLMQTLGANRTDNHGAYLVEKLLKVRFPNLSFIFVSFCSSLTLTHECLIYDDFLKLINNNFNGRP